MMEGSDAVAAAAASPPPLPSDVSAPPAKLFTREQVDAMLCADKFKKKFLKQKCAECGVACTKTYKTGGPLIARNMVDAFWCNSCGRILCPKHRSGQLHRSGGQ